MPSAATASCTPLHHASATASIGCSREPRASQQALAAPALFDHRNRAKSLPLCICAVLPWMHTTVEAIPSVKCQDTTKPESPRPDPSSTPSDSSRPSCTTTPDDATSTPTMCTSTPPRPDRQVPRRRVYHYRRPEHLRKRVQLQSREHLLPLRHEYNYFHYDP